MTQYICQWCSEPIILEQQPCTSTLIGWYHTACWTEQYEDEDEADYDPLGPLLGEDPWL